MKYIYLIAISLFFMACGGAEVEERVENKDSVKIEVDEKVTEGEVDAEDEAVSFDITEDRLKKFVPEGYRIVRWKSGNLNMDERDDVILVIEKLDVEDETESTASTDDYDEIENRPLLILTMNEDGILQEAARNDKVVIPVTYGGVMGDPFGGAGDIVIKNGYFSIESMGGSNYRWSRITTFKYNTTKKSWFLHKDGQITWHTHEANSEKETVYSTKDFGVVPFEAYNHKNRF